MDNVMIVQIADTRRDLLQVVANLGLGEGAATFVQLH